MCDYSLHTVPNRLADQGEELVLHRFATGTLGFASRADLEKDAKQTATEPQGFWASLKGLLSPRPCPEIPAVCVPPGARLFIADMPLELRNSLRAGPSEIAVFTETSNQPYSYRDALVFSNGKPVLLQDLPEGLHAFVLSTSSSEDMAREPVLENTSV